MKRKRGPAPSKKETKAKDVAVEEAGGMHGSDEETGIENADDSSFHGFSSDGDEMQVDGQETRTNGQQNGQSKERKKGKKAEPTQEELMELMFRSSSFQSNLFKLQVDELLSEVRVKYDKMDKVEKILHQIKEVLTNVPETAEQLVLQSSYHI
jgi:U3 small nucleolar RNA-associated protein 22